MLQTIQHTSSKINNFMGDEVSLAIMDNLIAANKAQANQTKIVEQKPVGSHSLSPSMKSKGRNQQFLSHLRHSQENRPTSSIYYSNNTSTFD